MTGHGCFGQFLHRIGRDDTPECRHCTAAVDSAQHTLAECAAWAEERRDLTRVVGHDLDLPVVVDRMLREEEAWTAMIRFSERVLLQKEKAERLRRGEAPRNVPAGQRVRRRRNHPQRER